MNIPPIAISLPRQEPLPKANCELACLACLPTWAKVVIVVAAAFAALKTLLLVGGCVKLLFTAVILAPILAIAAIITACFCKSSEDGKEHDKVGGGHSRSSTSFDIGFGGFGSSTRSYPSTPPRTGGFGRSPHPSPWTPGPSGDFKTNRSSSNWDAKTNGPSYDAKR
jgi:hypothetical protein